MSFFVEADEAVGQLVVEGVDVIKKEIFVERDELLLDAAVKAFGMGPIFGQLGQVSHRAAPSPSTVLVKPALNWLALSDTTRWGLQGQQARARCHRRAAFLANVCFLVEHGWH